MWKQRHLEHPKKKVAILRRRNQQGLARTSQKQQNFKYVWKQGDLEHRMTQAAILRRRNDNFRLKNTDANLNVKTEYFETFSKTKKNEKSSHAKLSFYLSETLTFKI